MITFASNEGTNNILISTPHAGTARFDDNDSNVIREQVKNIADLHVDAITDRVERMIHGCWDVRSPMTRLECDIERFDDEREEMNAVGMGVIYTNGINGENLYDEPLSDAIIANRKNTVDNIIVGDYLWAQPQRLNQQ